MTPARTASLLLVCGLATGCGDSAERGSAGDGSARDATGDATMPSTGGRASTGGTGGRASSGGAAGRMQADATIRPLDGSAEPSVPDGATREAGADGESSVQSGDAATRDVYQDAGAIVDASIDGATRADASLEGGGRDGEGSDGAPEAAPDVIAGEADARAADDGSASRDGGGPDGSGACPRPAIPELGVVPVVSGMGLDTLSFAVQPPSSDDWYLVEQAGRILVFSEGSLRTTPFLDLSDEVRINAIYDERGIGGLAFPPDYATSGLFYIVMTPSAGADLNRDLLLEFRRSESNPYAADTTSRRVLYDFANSSSLLGNIHNAYTIRFGPDGMLYLGMGDGGGVQCNNIEPDAPQRLDSPFGKILRLDLTANPPYGAADNPFAGEGDPRVLHYGLRNPYRFSFDRVTGDLYIGDVGQNSYEEIDFAPAGSTGLNFGWAPFEGATRTCTNRNLRQGSEHTPPIFVADRRFNCTGQFCDFQAIVGGFVYRGTAIPELYGSYLFGDYQGRRMVALRQCGERTSELAILRKQCSPSFPDEACLAPQESAPEVGELRAVAEDHDGELYLVANGDSLLKIVPLD